MTSTRLDSVMRDAAPAEPRECPCCGKGTLRVFHEVPNVPTNSCILLDSREEALRWTRGDIRLGFCDHCGFIGNTAFEPAKTEYSARYEETQAFSPTFNAFHRSLAEDLVARHALSNKRVLEIGCGKGEFLHLLCELGGNRGLGFDPGYSEERGAELGCAEVEVVRDFFSEAYTHHRADLVCCKMTLEHIPEPQAFIELATQVVERPDGVVFVQVPEARRIVEDCAFEDIYYEHCSYFTEAALRGLFEGLGFTVTDAVTTYGGQYLTVEARPFTETRRQREPSGAHVEVLRDLIQSFEERVGARLRYWERLLDEWQRSQRQVVVWGSGSKAVAFLSAVPNPEVVQYAVDINPYRQGYFIPGTGQQIVSPDRLAELDVDVVIVMNEMYLEEIRECLAELGLRPELHAL